MLEIDAKKVLLARAIEEREPGRWPDEVIKAARAEAGEIDDRPDWLVRRARYLIERADPALQSLLGATIPPRLLWLLLPFAALAIGLATSPLGPSERIHAFINPLMGLILWNLGLYVAMLLAPLLRRAIGAGESSGPPAIVSAVDTTVRSFGWLGRAVWVVLRGAGRLLRRLTGTNEPLDEIGEASPLGAAGRAYQAMYASACTKLVMRRASAISSLAAIGFALGTLAGMYLRGIGYDYHVTWESTLVGSAAGRESLLRAIFIPAVALLGDRFPDSAQIAALASGSGAPAAIWLHVYAICAVAYILLPRFGLAVYNLVLANRAAADVRLDLEQPAWQRVFEPPRGGDLHDLERSVMRDFALDANATTVLASFQAALIEADVRQTSAGGMRDVLGAKKEWYRRWTQLWDRRFEAFANVERPSILPLDSLELRHAVERLAQSPNPYAADLILLELASFTAYWPLGAEKPSRWRRMLPSLSIRSSVQEQMLRELAARLAAPPSAARDLHADLQRTLKSLSNYWVRLGVGAAGGVALGALTFGIAAPLIGGAIGSAIGLSTAALHAGLAALGFGAVSAGGLGLSGGTTIIVGGGALLGMVGGSSAATLPTSLTAESALLLSAKIEVFLRQIVVGKHSEWGEYDSILAGLAEATGEFRDSLPELRLASEVTTAQVRDRERVLEVLEKTLERGESWAKSHRPAGAGA